MSEISIAAIGIVTVIIFAYLMGILVGYIWGRCRSI